MKIFNKLFCFLLASLFNLSFILASVPELEVTFLDVGQGDAIFLKMPNGKTMLIDAGGIPAWKESSYDPGAAVILPFLIKNKVKRLDCVIATHADGDHIGGMSAVLDKIPTSIVYENSLESEQPEYRTLHQTMKRKNIAGCLLRQGMTINLDPSVKIDVLSPPKDFLFENENNNSIVLRLVHREVSFLFTGDSEYEAEENIMKHYGDKIESIILKVGHHGSSTSTSDEFLGLVAPECAVISVGKYNNFGHPYSGILAKLSDAGIETFRTDRHGDVTIYTDGDTFFVKPEREPFSKKKK
ncbi:MAG: ComEC family competence protein [Elusimicrobia bacterium ADurb.Bin231]|nr:MAG: ComEC family competence protein [Elusimicrobia bacterium ADurb.Bin231]